MGISGDRKISISKMWKSFKHKQSGKEADWGELVLKKKHIPKLEQVKRIAKEGKGIQNS